MKLLRLVGWIFAAIVFYGIAATIGILTYLFIISNWDSSIKQFVSSSPPDAIIRQMRDFVIQNPNITAGVGQLLSISAGLWLAYCGLMVLQPTARGILDLIADEK